MNTHEEDVARTPQPPLKTTTPNTNANPTPWWVKSDNPTVIKPTRNTTTVPLQSPATTNTRPKANPQRIILQFNTLIRETMRKKAVITRQEINTLLYTLEVTI